MQALTLACYRLWCWRINSLLQRFYEHHSLRFQLNCVLFFRELIESLSPLWVHHAGWSGFCWLIFVADPRLKCLIVWWLYAVRLTGVGCSYLDSINQNLASWLLSIQIPDHSNGQIIIAKKILNELPVWYLISLHFTFPPSIQYPHSRGLIIVTWPLLVIIGCIAAADAAQMSLNLWICTSTESPGLTSPRDYDDWLLILGVLCCREMEGWVMAAYNLIGAPSPAAAALVIISWTRHNDRPG